METHAGSLRGLNICTEHIPTPVSHCKDLLHNRAKWGLGVALLTGADKLIISCLSKVIFNGEWLGTIR